MLSGSCCCGVVKFTLSRAPSMMGTCHCTRCRKHGASTLVFVERDSFALVSGADAVVTYRPAAPYKYNRCFCSHCGTSLGDITADSPFFPVSANCFDDELGIGNQFHMFVKDKPSWYGICDDAQQFPENPPQ